MGAKQKGMEMDGWLVGAFSWFVFALIGVHWTN
jgi:hypothetical protein